MSHFIGTRFSLNPLVQLPQASTGEWINDSTMILKLDLIAAVNLYSLKIDFAERGEKIYIDLLEGSGLNNERVIGEEIK